MNVLKLEVVIGMPQLFIRKEKGRLVMIVAKYVNDILIAALNDEWLNYSRKGIDQCFEIGSLKQIPHEIDVNGTEVEKKPIGVILQSVKKGKEIKTVELSPARGKDITSEITKLEQREIGSMAGKLGYAGVCSMPIAAFGASFIQQMTPKMTIAGVKVANGIALDAIKKGSKILYNSIDKDSRKDAQIVVFSDADFPHQGVTKKVTQ